MNLIGPMIVLLGASAMGSITLAAAVGQDQSPPGSVSSAGQVPGAHVTQAINPGGPVNMHGMHTLPATVTDADPNTGIVDVMAEGMALRVHFPPASMVNLKAGDKIGLYMAFSQAEVVK